MGDNKPTRATLLALIREKPRRISELAKHFKMSSAEFLLVPDLTAMRRRGELMIAGGHLQKVR